jgi:LAS superfamily LD-carboxypeptidase LdcB
MGFQGLIPELQPYATALYSLASQYRLAPRITSVRRSLAEQQILYERYLRGDAAFTAAPPGRSLHNYGHAFDLVVNSPEAQAWLGKVWEAWGGRWGGRFKDPVHFDTGVLIP